MDEMIKYVANEPSVGLYFVQQHARASMPLLLDVKVHRLACLPLPPCFASFPLCMLSCALGISIHIGLLGAIRL